MVLTDKFNRVLLWGAEIEGAYVKAELAFFASSLRREQVELFDRKQQAVVTINLDSKYLRSNFPIKAQMLYFDVV